MSAWEVVGWLVVVLLVTGIISMIIIMPKAVRMVRRGMAEADKAHAEIDAYIRERQESIRSGARPVGLRRFKL